MITGQKDKGFFEWSRWYSHPSTLSILISLVLIGFSFYSSRLGLPWSDEASDILPSYKFLLGQIPFVDEFNILQLSNILTYPVFKLFYLFNHHQINGLFIFARSFYTVLAVLSSIYLIRLLSFYIPVYLAILIAINMACFAPLGLRSPFYDNLALLFLTLGFFSLFRAVDLSINSATNPKWMLLASGVWLGLSAAVYPPLGLCWFFIGLAYKQLSLERLTFYLIGIALGCAWLAVVIGYIGIQPFLAALHKNSTGNSSLIEGFEFGLKPAIIWYYQIAKDISPFLTSLVMLGFFQRYFKHTALWQLALTTVLLSLIGWIIFRVHSPFGEGMGYTVALFLCAPFLYIFLNTHSQAKSLFYFVWIPSLLTFPIVAFVSALTGLSTVIALFSGALVSLIFIVLIVRSLICSDLIKKIHLLASFLAVLLVSYGYQFANLHYSYAEGHLKDPHCFDHGAFKNLCTSQPLFEFMQTLHQKLQPFAKQHKTLSILGPVGIGYFIDDFIPFNNDAYLTNINTIFSFFDLKGKYPDIMLIIYGGPKFLLYTPEQMNPIVSHLLSINYHPYFKGQYYDIYTRNLDMRTL